MKSTLISIFLPIALLLFVPHAHSQTYTFYADSSSTDANGQPLLVRCGKYPAQGCATVERTLELVAARCAARPNANFRLLLRSGMIFRETADLTLPCDNLLLSNYDVATGEPVSCFPTSNCPVITRARQINSSEWADVASTNVKTLPVSGTRLVRSILIEPQNLFLHGIRPDPETTGRKREFRRTSTLGLDQNCSPTFQGCDDQGYSLLDDDDWGERRINYDDTGSTLSNYTVAINDNQGRTLQSPPLEISSANFVLRTADPDGVTRKNITIEHVYMYGAGWTREGEPPIPHGGNWFRVRSATVLDVPNTEGININHVKLEASALHILSIRKGAKDVVVTDSDFSDGGLWCVDVRDLDTETNPSNVQFDRISAHHCGNNLGDTVDGHAFGVQTARGVVVKNSTFFANGYSGNKVGTQSNTNDPNDPTQSAVHAAFVLHRPGLVTVENNQISCNWRAGVTVGTTYGPVSFLSNKIAGNGRINLNQAQNSPDNVEYHPVHGFMGYFGCPSQDFVMKNNLLTKNILNTVHSHRGALTLFTSSVVDAGYCTGPGTVLIDEFSNNRVCDTYHTYSGVAEDKSFNCKNFNSGGDISIATSFGNSHDTTVTGCSAYDPNVTHPNDFPYSPANCDAPELTDPNLLHDLVACVVWTQTSTQPWQ